ncbi:hypothetical protein RD110_26625 [Rhodoferax koreense]|uniref:Dihydrodipicolinate synthase family protein n=2 Tax=Rhodoferax koreensis TaxID=1842727 RepID=A0A1P8K2U9_9BURK|nr:hypothetical protein RD110_26625 [Rhodoferax koreense]
MPFQPDGQLDLPRTIAHAKRMMAAGSDGVTLFGTTGEGLAFSVAERKRVLEAVLAAGITPDQVITTTTACALEEAIDLGRHAIALGVKRQLYMPPFFFNHPRDAGVVECVSQVIQGIGNDSLQMLLYHFPSLANVGFSHTAIAELVRRHPKQVIGVKDSSGDLEHSLGLVKAFPALSIFVGSEPHIAPVMRAGGSGSVNGMANVAPHLLRRIISSPQTVSKADEQLVLDLLRLMTVLPGMPFVSAYKVGLAEQMGDDVWLNVRAPLTKLEPEEEKAVREVYRATNQSFDTI